MTMDTSYHDDGPIALDDMKDRRHDFLYVERGMPEPRRRDSHYDRLTRELRKAVEHITDEAELARFIAAMKLTSKDVEQMLNFLAIHARYFVALSRLAEGHLKALNLPHQPFPMSGAMMFHDPEDVEDGIAELAEHGIEVKVREEPGRLLRPNCLCGVVRRQRPRCQRVLHLGERVGRAARRRDI